MKSLKVPEEVAAALRELVGDRIEIRDPQGWLIGHFEPIWTAKDLAEAERALAENHPGYSLKEVWEHIHAMEKKDEVHRGLDTPSGGTSGQPMAPRPG